MACRVSVSLIIAACIASVLLGAENHPYEPVGPDGIVGQLTKTEIFAFSGVGFASVISKGENEYRALLSRPSAARDLETVFALGNAQAKAYALVGLRQINPRRFEQLAKSLETSSTRVQTMRGCILFSVPMSEIVSSIRTGIYSGQLTYDVVAPR